MNTKNRTRKLVGIALFSAIVVVLQLLGSFIRLGQFSISLVLIPIVVGSAVYGMGAGTWLGFIFGVTVLISGDAATFLAISPIGTVITVLAKGTLAGLGVDILYSLLNKVNRYLAVIVSAIVCPVINTGVFLIGCKLFFWETIKEWSAASEYGSADCIFLPGKRQSCRHGSHDPAYPAEHHPHGSSVLRLESASFPGTAAPFLPAGQNSILHCHDR